MAWLSPSSSSSTCTYDKRSTSRGKRPQRVVLVRQQRLAAAAKAGTFFNPIPEGSGDDDKNNNNADDDILDAETTILPMPPLGFDASVMELIRQRKGPSLASQPSTVNGKPVTYSGSGSGVGFGNLKVTKVIPPPSLKEKSKPFTAIGPTLNDISKPEYDDQGYTLYANEETGQKSRVFEALVEYPCNFVLKIVGANEGTFVEEMVTIVAESCRVENVADISHSIRTLGKWTSVTVHAPVQSAEMLYRLYENVDRDPRVKFKF
jgi:putative lipoic acid-binding regulatory protein